MESVTAENPEWPVPHSLAELTALLRDELGSDGLDTLDEKRLAKVTYLLDAYKSNEDDWKRYAVFDPNKYTRNLVDDGNGKFNLMVLAWGEGHHSAIHDHAGSHCLVKILDGEIVETKFDWPNKEEEGKPLTVKSEERHKRDAVTYMHDKIGLHRVENQSHTKGAITLHLYTPPYSECRTFVETTGQQRASGKMTFHTGKVPPKKSKEHQQQLIAEQELLMQQLAERGKPLPVNAAPAAKPTAGDDAMTSGGERQPGKKKKTKAKTSTPASSDSASTDGLVPVPAVVPSAVVAAVVATADREAMLLDQLAATTAAPSSPERLPAEEPDEFMSPVISRKGPAANIRAHLSDNARRFQQPDLEAASAAKSNKAVTTPTTPGQGSSSMISPAPSPVLNRATDALFKHPQSPMIARPRLARQALLSDELVPPKGGSDSSNSIGGGRSASGGIGSGLDANRDLDPFFMSPNIIGSLDAGGTVGDAAMATLESTPIIPTEIVNQHSQQSSSPVLGPITSAQLKFSSADLLQRQPARNLDEDRKPDVVIDEQHPPGPAVVVECDNGRSLVSQLVLASAAPMLFVNRAASQQTSIVDLETHRSWTLPQMDSRTLLDACFFAADAALLVLLQDPLKQLSLRLLRLPKSDDPLFQTVWEYIVSTESVPPTDCSSATSACHTFSSAVLDDAPGKPCQRRRLVTIEGDGCVYVYVSSGASATVIELTVSVGVHESVIVKDTRALSFDSTVLDMCACRANNHATPPVPSVPPVLAVLTSAKPTISFWHASSAAILCHTTLPGTAGGVRLTRGWLVYGPWTTATVIPPIALLVASSRGASLVAFTEKSCTELAAFSSKSGGRFDDIGASARFVFGFAQDCDRQDQHRIAVWDLLSPNQPPIARMTLPEKAVVNCCVAHEVLPWLVYVDGSDVLARRFATIV